MSINTRRIITIIFILLFLILAPAIIFYANGNILNDGWNILATGGVYIKSMAPGAELYVNGKIKQNTNFFTRDYFLKNLKPGSYTIVVKKEGYNEWTNKIKVLANRVSERSVFMLPTKIIVSEIKPFLEIEKNIATSTSKKARPNPDYKMIETLFSDTSILGKYLSVFSTTTGKTIKYAPGTKENPIENRHLLIWREGGEIYIGWDGNLDSSPKIFCEEARTDIKCERKLKIYTFDSDVANLDFFPGETEVVIVSVKDSVFAIEVENNPDKKLQLLYHGEKPDFRIFNNFIYIKEGDFLGKVEI